VPLPEEFVQARLQRRVPSSRGEIVHLERIGSEVEEVVMLGGLRRLPAGLLVAEHLGAEQVGGGAHADLRELPFDERPGPDAALRFPGQQGRQIRALEAGERIATEYHIRKMHRSSSYRTVLTP